MREGRGPSPEDENRRLLRARDAIDRDWARPLDVPALAALAYLSPAHFSRRFRQLFGETPHRYLQRRRMERASAWLRDSDVPITRIAFLVGYESLGTFSRTFTSVFGTSPSSYRMAMRGTRSGPPSCVVARWTRPRSRPGTPPRTPPPPESSFG
ncbi:AraC-type DNA-binding protein [Streptomyces zhaozhouensis]|uniref:AraC-type DNA-binding protein n=1 Tax=Streptomyces zhaozhouensis TaxID=1300267 RepID=A0A286E1U9_9ACTN|nr:helix-turn-helix transcriptional regulator [Streptomyces zhaozhouensis]SOD64888.1 AraC-type DNA-binding protein [Streptomyces zhaozhouensis]